GPTATPNTRGLHGTGRVSRVTAGSYIIPTLGGRIPMHKRFAALLIVVAGTVGTLHAQASRTALPRVAPTVDQILPLKRAVSTQISPDGRAVAYTVRETNWDDNA